MAAAKTTVKPYKLKPSGDSLTRDDLSTWREVILSHMRQNEKWKDFLPGGTKSTWKAEDDTEEDNWTLEVKAALADFITCVATYSPAGFGETIKRESTSFNWVIDLIKETYGLKTRGEHFLGLEDLKFTFDGGFTYQQAYMEVKDFVCAGLLSATDRFEGKPRADKETLSPVAKNFICKEWLCKIDPRLPKHILDTRGHLFTADKPTLSCNQKIICNQIPTLLAELDGKTDDAGEAVTVGYVPASRRPPSRPPRGGRGLLRGAGTFRGYPPRALPPRPQYVSGCQRCLEAIPARVDASRTHATKDCLWPPNTAQNSRPRANFRVVLVPEEEYANNEDYYEENDVFTSQFYPDSNIEDITDSYDNKDSLQYSCSSSTPTLNFNSLPIRKVQTISVKINDMNETLTIDSGSEGNCIRLDTCQKLNLQILPLDKDEKAVPTQADGKSLLEIVGQTKFVAIRGKVSLHWSGFVAKTLSSAILCGGPFIEQNKIVQELHHNRIVIDNKHYFLEDSPFRPNVAVNNVNVKEAIVIGEKVPKSVREKLISIHVAHENVFDGDLTEGYNGYSGNFDVDFHFKGGIPPTPNYDNTPCYFSNQDKLLLQAKIDELEEKGICMKVSNSNIIPKYAAPCMLVKKHSVRALKPGEYENLATFDKLKYNRFILCHNKLSEHIEKQPARMNRLDDVVKTVGEFEFVITSDLSDSFWQRHIADSKLPYFAFHSPFKGPYIFLRSTQGLINQSEGLEQLVSVILGDCIMAGWCVVLADNIYVMGHTMEDTVKHWQLVLDLLSVNNIKLSAKKTACFPEKLDLLGWTKVGKHLVPDSHRQNVIANAPLPDSVKDLRSYLGAYRTFFRCKKNMSNILKDLEEFQANKKSSEKLLWTEELKQKFVESKKEILQLDKLYLPKPSDQLVMTSDWSEKGISATLWAMVDNVPHVVSRFSARLEKSMENMLTSASVKPKTLPCDGEMAAVYVGIKSPVFSSHIKSSNNKTVCLVDNKPVVEASKLIKDGKFSSSRVINNLMTAISEYNLEFQHLSSKMGQNIIDDFGSRNPMKCQNGSSCKLCSFIKDCEGLTIGSLSFAVADETLIGNIDLKSQNLIQDILHGKKSVPFNNRKALKYLQDRDPDLILLRDYLISGKRPTTKQTKINKVKRYLQKHGKGLTIAKDGCLVVTKRDKHLNSRELVVIPDDISLGLIYAMHINLNHPSPFQLSQLLDTKFFILNKEAKVREISESCTLCCSVAKIPKEIETFKPNVMPDHPGKSFTVDILKMNKRNVMVTVENFSGFISTTFVDTEKTDDLLEGILLTTSPLRSSFSSKIHIRVDQAPGFKSLAKQKKELDDLGIDLELGNAKNKNAVAIVDKKIKELNDEIKKLSNTVIDFKILSKATSIVNEKVRHQGLSSKEILFSRDQFSNTNLDLNDEHIAEDKMKKRIESNKYSAKSKAQIQVEAIAANAKKGHIVLMKHETSKHSRRELYIVLDTDDASQTLVIAKLPHALSGSQPISFQPHNVTYIVKQTDIFLSPNQPTILKEPQSFEYCEEVDEVPIIPQPKVNPQYPYDDFDDDEIEYEDIDDDNQGDDSNTDYDSATDHDVDADDEETGEPGSSSPGSDNDSILEVGNVLVRDNENEPEGAVALEQPEEIICDQSRMPKKGDIVSFVYGDIWVNAKILHKAKSSNHYNVILQDGVKLNIQLNPQASWSLMSADNWNPEQLRFEVENEISSMEASPVLNYDRNPSLHYSPQQSMPLQLSLTPEEQIQRGQVYTLPQSQLLQIQIRNQPKVFQIDQKDYERRYNKLVRSIDLPAHEQSDFVNFLIYNQLYEEQNSFSNKLKKAFSRK